DAEGVAQLLERGNQQLEFAGVALVRDQLEPGQEQVADQATFKRGRVATTLDDQLVEPLHEVRLIDPPGPWGDGGGVGEARAGAVAGRGTRGVIERRCAGTVVHSLELSWPPTGAEARAGLAWGGWTRGAPRKMVPSIRRVAGSWINSDR